MGVVRRRLTTIASSHRLIPAVRGRLASLATFAVNSSAAITCTTGCLEYVDAIRAVVSVQDPNEARAAEQGKILTSTKRVDLQPSVGEERGTG